MATSITDLFPSHVWKPNEKLALIFHAVHLKGVCMKIFYNTDPFILLLQSDNELPMSEMQKNWGVTDFIYEVKRVENYP